MPDLFQAATRSGARGINILLHGPTGTGKTQFARLVAKMLGMPLHAAGRADDEGESADWQERLRSLRLGNRIAAPARRCCSSMSSRISSDGI